MIIFISLQKNNRIKSGNLNRLLTNSKYGEEGLKDGPLAPVASNKNEAGRAKNRRVALGNWSEGENFTKMREYFQKQKRNYYKIF